MLEDPKKGGLDRVTEDSDVCTALILGQKVDFSHICIYPSLGRMGDLGRV